MFMRGMVISVPIPHPQSGIPLSAQEASPYTIRLIEGSIHQVSPALLEKFVTTSSSSTSKIKFPSWLGNNQKVMYLRDGLYVKGVMELSLDEHNWRFCQCCRNGVKNFVIVLPNFCDDFQKYINDGSIIPG
jgi:hypothetical protein